LNLVVAASFSMLSLLPAVLLHASLEGAWPVLSGAGYALSSAAVVMHFWEIRSHGGAALHQTALLVITVGFLILAIVAVAAPVLRRRRSGIRILASMCLALFAMSFVHFGNGHASQAWSSELVVHHAGIPLALFVLLQDYRFVLLDAFVRFLTNALLAAILTGLVIAVAFRLLLVERIAQAPLHEALLLISICLFLVFFAWLRNRVQGWLTQAIFRHGSVAGLASRVKDCPAFSDEDQYVDWAAALIAAAVKTKDYAVIAQNQLDGTADLHAPVLASLLPVSRSPQWNWAEVVVPVRRGQGDVQLILLGRRHGGQRYFSEDLDALGRAGMEIVERVEGLRRQEMNRLVSHAELRALQSQINPHFLFNALNTLYGTIPREASTARHMVVNLAEIFRYFLQSDRTFVPLAQEMQIVRAYLEVEQLRLGDRLKVDFHVDQAALDLPVPVLSLQPLVENAIKHGITQTVEPGYVLVRIELRESELHIMVENSSSQNTAEMAGGGIGLQNVRRRLEICYGPGATLRLAPDLHKTTAEISIPLVAAGDAR
jgi:two-component system, LytTR family, sensor kinase